MIWIVYEIFNNTVLFGLIGFFGLSLIAYVLANMWRKNERGKRNR